MKFEKNKRYFSENINQIPSPKSLKMVVPNSFEESDISHSKTEEALGLTFFVGKNKELPEITSVVPTPPKKSFRLFFQR